jgi:hypothetical protein
VKRLRRPALLPEADPLPRWLQNAASSAAPPAAEPPREAPLLESPGLTLGEPEVALRLECPL